MAKRVHSIAVIGVVAAALMILAVGCAHHGEHPSSDHPTTGQTKPEHPDHPK